MYLLILTQQSETQDCFDGATGSKEVSCGFSLLLNKQIFLQLWFFSLPFHPLPQIPGCLYVISSEVWITLRKWRSCPHSFVLTVSPALGSNLFCSRQMNLFTLLHWPSPSTTSYWVVSWQGSSPSLLLLSLLTTSFEEDCSSPSKKMIFFFWLNLPDSSQPVVTGVVFLHLKWQHFALSV